MLGWKQVKMHIDISQETWELVQKFAVPYADKTPCDTLRRIFMVFFESHLVEAPQANAEEGTGSIGSEGWKESLIHIDVSEETWKLIKRAAEPFADKTPDNTVRRVCMAVSEFQKAHAGEETAPIDHDVASLRDQY